MVNYDYRIGYTNTKRHYIYYFQSPAIFLRASVRGRKFEERDREGGFLVITVGEREVSARAFSESSPCLVCSVFLALVKDKWLA